MLISHMAWSRNTSRMNRDSKRQTSSFLSLSIYTAKPPVYFLPPAEDNSSQQKKKGKRDDWTCCRPFHVTAAASLHSPAEPGRRRLVLIVLVSSGKRLWLIVLRADGHLTPLLDDVEECNILYPAFHALPSSASNTFRKSI
jgi:hypothetical protein